MKKNLFLFPLILLLSKAFAQKLNEKLEYKVTYQLTYKLDSTASPQSEYMILYTGENLSRFSSRAKRIIPLN